MFKYNIVEKNTHEKLSTTIYYSAKGNSILKFYQVMQL